MFLIVVYDSQTRLVPVTHRAPPLGTPDEKFGPNTRQGDIRLRLLPCLPGSGKVKFFLTRTSGKMYCHTVSITKTFANNIGSALSKTDDSVKDAPAYCRSFLDSLPF